MTARVIIDGRALVGNRTGISVHTAEIASRLEPPPVIAAHEPIDDRTSLGRSRIVVDPTPFGVAWQQLRLPRIAAREECNVLWGPHGTLPLNLRIPAVVTVHDLTSITMPHRHRIRTLLSFNLLIARSLDMAHGIAAVSRTAAEEIVRGFGIRRGKIEIVPNGVDPFFSPGTAEEIARFGVTARDYILFAGTLEPRKGVGDLLDAWERIDRAPRLVIAGDPGWGESSLRRRIESHPRRREIVVTGYVDREALRALYRGALTFVYPSHFEGFGLPPLEAMACETPVIASNGGALPEVVGDAAMIVGVRDAAALRRAIERVLADRALRDELIARGVARARMFSWDSSARTIGEMLERASG